MSNNFEKTDGESTGNNAASGESLDDGERESLSNSIKATFIKSESGTSKERGEEKGSVIKDKLVEDPRLDNMKSSSEERKPKRSESSSPLSSSSGEEEDLEGDEDDDDDEDKLSTTRSRSTSPLQSSRRRQSPFPSSAFSAPTMDTLSNAVVNVFSLTCGIFVFAVFLLGSYDYFKNVEANKCDMTWMYRKPFYVPIPVNANPLENDQENFPMYKLYVYTEGEIARKAVSEETHQFTGIPVLFIPGNAGSYQQVRSLASLALWKYIDAETPFHFDFFTVDLNEEFSALYGYTLQRQTEFVRRAVHRIMNLYEDFHKVVLIGHSMGGVIAKAVAMDQSLGDGNLLSNLVVTFATPHASPVAIFDPEQDFFYYSVKRNWTKHLESGNQLSLLSVAGGERDFLVFPKLTRWPNSVHTIATAVPGVWASTDHLCIVWCKQLVLTTVRALFDLVEFNQRNKYYVITDNEDTKQSILKYHFVQRSSGKSFYTSILSNQSVLPRIIDHVEVTSGIHCLSAGERPKYLLFPRSFLIQNVTSSEDLLDNQVNDYTLTVLTTNTKDKMWIMGCTKVSPTGQCAHAENLVRFGRIIPHIRRRRKVATLPLALIVSKYSHLVIKMDTYAFKTCVMLESFNPHDRTRPLGGTFQSNYQIFHNLTFSPFGFSSYLASWKVSVQPDNMNCPDSYNLLGQFSHGHFEQSRFLKNESLLVRHVDWNVSSSSVQLYLDPTCNYTVTTTLALIETTGQFFRVVVRLLPSFYASVVLMSLYFQKDPVDWSSFHVVLLSNAYHLSIFPGFCTTLMLHFIPTDWPVMIDAGEFSVIVPMACFLIAYALVLAVSTGTWYAIITGGTALHSVFVRVLSSRLGSWVPRLLSNHRGFTSVTEHVTEAAFEMSLTRFPLTIAVILLAISFATCGSLGIALALALYVIKLFKIYEDLLEDLLKAKIANVTDCLSPMNFHFACYMLWLVLTVLNVPSLLHWSRSFTMEATPQWDLGMYLCLLALPTVAILWQDFAPKMEPTIWKLHRYVFYAMGIASVLWGTHRLYVTAFIITFVFLTMAICQLISVIMNSLAANLNTGGGDTTTTTPPSSSSEQTATTTTTTEHQSATTGGSSSSTADGTNTTTTT